MADKNAKDKKTDEIIESLNRLQDELKGLCMPSGDINFFIATAMLTQEIKHSAFLAWLLDPSKEHNLGTAMLQRFVERLFRYAGAISGSIKSNSEILRSKNVDENSLLGACKNGEIGVETEVASSAGKRADIRISLSNTDTKEKYSILIENKVFSTTHDDQLSEYEILAEEQSFDGKTVFVYLTPTGELPYNIGGDRKYNDNWCIFDYVEVRDIVKDLLDEIADKNKSSNLDSKKRAKLKLMMEDYIALLNNSILIENPDVWDKIRQIRKNYSKELELINSWRDSGGDALRYCHEHVKEIFAGKIHFIMGETLEENACAFRFYTDEIKTAFEADGDFGEGTKTPRCYIECTATYGSIQLLVQKRGEWKPRQIKAIEKISNVKSLPNSPDKLLFQVYYLEKGDRAKPFGEEMKQHIDDCLQKFADRLATTLNEISKLTS